jgi:hypothetical protein
MAKIAKSLGADLIRNTMSLPHRKTMLVSSHWQQKKQDAEQLNFDGCLGEIPAQEHCRDDSWSENAGVTGLFFVGMIWHFFV